MKKKKIFSKYDSLGVPLGVGVDLPPKGMIYSFTLYRHTICMQFW